MKSIKYPSVFSVILVLLFIFKFSSCEQEDLEGYVNCNDCLEYSPEWDTLWVRVTINEENPFVPLVFFLGDYENGDIDWIDTTYTEEYWLISKVDTRYSVKATYRRGAKLVNAVDGDELRVVNGDEDCYSPCYFVRGGTMDVRLKE